MTLVSKLEQSAYRIRRFALHLGHTQLVEVDAGHQ